MKARPTGRVTVWVVAVLLSGPLGCTDDASSGSTPATADPSPEQSPGGSGNGTESSGGAAEIGDGEPEPDRLPSPAVDEPAPAAGGSMTTPTSDTGGDASAGGVRGVPETTGGGGSSGATATMGGTSGVAGAPLAGAAGAVTGGAPPVDDGFTPNFETLALSTDFVSEGAAVADLDADGTLDLVAGPLWYRGPSFELGGEISPAPVLSPEEYSLFFLTFADDLNGDDLPDVIAIGDAGGGNGTGNPNAHWYENPGPGGHDEHWTQRPLFDGLVSNESPAYLDLIGDDAPELVFMTDRELGYATPASDPTEPWEFHAISGGEFNTPYVHGLGVGDVDGDGSNDVIEASGYWLQQPDGSFERIEVDFTEGVMDGVRGGAQMFAFDVDGDDDADVVTSLSGHGYGMSWFEQTAPGAFAAHAILPATAMGDSFSQLHALAAADLNGDGLLDLVTGKRYYAHRPPTDPGGTDPPVLYWFELVRSDGGAEFVPHLIHDDSGVGCNFTVADLDGNARPDVFVSNKKGNYVHLQ